MTHHKILNEEEFFSEFYADTFSDCPNDIYASVLEMIVPQNIVLIQTMWILDQQNDKKKP